MVYVALFEEQVTGTTLYEWHVRGDKRPVFDSYRLLLNIPIPSPQWGAAVGYDATVTKFSYYYVNQYGRSPTSVALESSGAKIDAGQTKNFHIIAILKANLKLKKTFVQGSCPSHSSYKKILQLF